MGDGRGWRTVQCSCEHVKHGLLHSPERSWLGLKNIPPALKGLSLVEAMHHRLRCTFVCTLEQYFLLAHFWSVDRFHGE